jgi:hypothetical protein
VIGDQLFKVEEQSQLCFSAFLVVEHVDRLRIIFRIGGAW